MMIYIQRNTASESHVLDEKLLHIMYNNVRSTQRRPEQTSTCKTKHTQANLQTNYQEQHQEHITGRRATWTSNTRERILNNKPDSRTTLRSAAEWAHAPTITEDRMKDTRGNNSELEPKYR